MLFVLKNPVSGTMKTIDVKVGGTDEYELKGLSIKLTKMKDFFKGNYESKIFDGNDKLIGSSQSDKLSGYAGKDTINGGNGGDTIWGANGNDKLYGEAGNDLITGGKGNDLLDGGAGFNTLTGDAGSDTFQFSSQLSSSNSSSITDFKSGTGHHPARQVGVSGSHREAASWPRASSSSRPTMPARTAWSSTTRRRAGSRSPSTATA